MKIKKCYKRKGTDYRPKEEFLLVPSKQSYILQSPNSTRHIAKPWSTARSYR